MSRHLPPLNALRAFEAAARHLSFTRAAAELNVTPGAISHQVKGLEEIVGQPLFRRRARALLLTEAGQRALPALRDGFDLLADGAAAMERQDDSGILTITTSPSTAARWLVPRLDGFYARHTDIDIRLHATLDMVDFARDGIDAAVRYGRGHYPGTYTVLLSKDVITPVCSPTLLEGDHPLRRPEDLRHHHLIHVDIAEFQGIYPTWDMWLKAAGVAGIDTRRGSRFMIAELAMRAAVEGQGVALGERLLIADDIASGRLVAPFDPALNLRPDFGYYFVCPEGRETDPRIAAFHAWLVEEMAKPGGKPQPQQAAPNRHPERDAAPE
ncbi:MAG: transcriptional regulator GcvA [Alphaproteobacteria bacterium]|nr:transcriptional regulator GcvA [Alphaproteobacteria bacterium]